MLRPYTVFIFSDSSAMNRCVFSDGKFINPLTHVLGQTSLEAAVGTLALFAARKGLHEPNSFAYLDSSLIARMANAVAEMHSGARTRALALFRFIHTRTPALNRPQKPFRVAWTDRRREKREHSNQLYQSEILHNTDMPLAMLIEGMSKTMWLFD